MSGTAEAGSTVRVTWGTVTKSVLVDTHGNWSASFAQGELPAAGTTSVKAVATDAAGNASAESTQAVAVRP